MGLGLYSIASSCFAVVFLVLAWVGRAQKHSFYYPAKPQTFRFKKCDAAGVPSESESEELTIKQLVEARVPAAFEPFKPSWWLPGGDFQTAYVVGGNFEEVDKVVYERTLIRLPDGGTLGLDMAPPSKDAVDLPAETPIVVVQHGLTGGSFEPYVRSVLSVVTLPKSKGGLGLRAFVVNFRGCADVPFTSAQMYSAQNTDDLRSGLLYITSKYPNAPLLGAGFSLGANIITRYLGEEGVRSRLSSGLALACPWDLKKNSDRLLSTWLGKNVYSRAMGDSLFAMFKTHEDHWRTFPEDETLKTLIPKALAMKNVTLYDFDHHIARVIGGRRAPFPFASANDYYSNSSSHTALPDIRVPFLAFNSHDDPIVRSYPIAETPGSTACALVVTEHGGHLGWFTGGNPVGGGPPPDRWVRKPAVQWLKLCAEELVTQHPSSGPDAWIGRETGIGKDRVVREDGFVIDSEKDWIGYKVVEEGIVFTGVDKKRNLSAGI
ncbi:AB-hydrolase YheT [Clavulina sp. PMI_390]|nr:AB-hydrolase YheT [Clavulina sp. PMI_390]